MESFLQLFGTMIGFTYHCFDRIVIRGYLSMLSRPEHIVYFFRDVLGIRCITREVLAKRTIDYQNWVESYARNHGIPIEWAEKDVRKEDRVRPFLMKAKRTKSFGAYFILKSMEQATTFRSAVTKFTTTARAKVFEKGVLPHGPSSVLLHLAGRVVQQSDLPPPLPH
jgi:hypothetical protein